MRLVGVQDARAGLVDPDARHHDGLGGLLDRRCQQPPLRVRPAPLGHVLGDVREQRRLAPLGRVHDHVQEPDVRGIGMGAPREDRPEVRGLAGLGARPDVPLPEVGLGGGEAEGGEGGALDAIGLRPGGAEEVEGGLVGRLVSDLPVPVLDDAHQERRAVEKRPQQPTPALGLVALLDLGGHVVLHADVVGQLPCGGADGRQVEAVVEPCAVLAVVPQQRVGRGSTRDGPADLIERLGLPVVRVVAGAVRADLEEPAVPPDDLLARVAGRVDEVLVHHHQRYQLSNSRQHFLE